MNEYYTLGSLLEFGGAVAAVTLVSAAVAYLAGDAVTPYAKWIALGVAMFLAYLGAFVTAAGADWTKWVVAFFNGIVLFLAAVGVNQIAAGRSSGAVRDAGGAVQPQAAVADPAPRRFWTSWL